MPGRSGTTWMRILLVVIGMIFSGRKVRHCTRCVMLLPRRANAVKMPLAALPSPGSNRIRSRPAAPSRSGGSTSTDAPLT